MPYKRKNGKRPRITRKARPARISKPLKLAVKKLIKGTQETKQIVSNPWSSAVYGKGMGLFAVTRDVFSVAQGVRDATIFNSANRIGDSVSGLGFKLVLRIAKRPTYVAPNVVLYHLPYIKFRILVLERREFTTVLSASMVFDSNILGWLEAPTLVPISKDNGFVKSVIYDKTFKITAVNSGTTLPLASSADDIVDGEMTFVKWFPYKKLIKYNDAASLPMVNSTRSPVDVFVIGEYDETLTSSSTPTGGTPLFNITGYTQAFYKDS